MSAKETLVQWTQQLPDEYGVTELLVALRDRYLEQKRSQVPVGNEDFAWPAPDLTEDEWRGLIVHSLQDELEDQRQDIYAADDQGLVDEPR